MKGIRPWVIIVAAGEGRRLCAHTGGVPKQFLLHEGAPLYWHTAQAFRHCARISGMVFVFPANYLEEERARVKRLNSACALGIEWHCVAGGERRQDSVRHGLAAVPVSCEHVLVHDAARPFVSAALVQRVIAALEAGDVGVVPALPVVDTIKDVQDGVVISTLERARLYAVQTPQGFVRGALSRAHEQALRELWDVTDDASLFERSGSCVRVVAGEACNVKITHAEDMALLHGQTPVAVGYRTGFGYDVHRFVARESADVVSRPLRLGGVLMDGALFVAAHSDGDVLLHALMDAILGCCGAGDIGLHFPDTSAKFDNADSAVLLQEVLHLLRQKSFRLTHVDVTIITQKPKVNPQRKAIVKNLAHLLHLPLECINVKATTEEGLGFTGSGAGIKVVALATVTVF